MSTQFNVYGDWTDPTQPSLSIDERSSKFDIDASGNARDVWQPSGEEVEIPDRAIVDIEIANGLSPAELIVAALKMMQPALYNMSGDVEVAKREIANFVLELDCGPKFDSLAQILDRET